MEKKEKEQFIEEAKAGKGVGSLDTSVGIKWTKQGCKEEALKYKYLSDFRSQSPDAFKTALKCQWILEYTWLSVHHTLSFDYDYCFRKAMKYHSRTRFRKCDETFYILAKQNGWLDDYIWMIPNKKWTYDTCLEEAKKYTSRGEFTKKSECAYDTARKNGWLDDYTWQSQKRKPNGYWNHQTCYEEAKKYTSRKEFESNSPTAYGISLKHRWIEDYTWFIPTRELLSKAEKWNYEACFNEAKKYKSRGEFSLSSASAYSRALKKGWLDDYDWLKEKRKKNGYWNYETCKREALKYSYKEEFKRNCLSGYTTAKRTGWIKDYTWFKQMQKPAGYWTYETCMEEPRQYSSRNEFRTGNGSAYGIARRNKWLDDYTWFRKKYKKS